MDESMEEINDALIGSIILKVFAQSAFRDSLMKKKKQKPKKLKKYHRSKTLIQKKIRSYIFKVYLNI